MLNLDGCSQKDLADLFGIEPSRIRQLITEGILPKKGTPDWGRECIQSYIAQLKVQTRRRTGGDDYNEERTRLTCAQADRQEFALLVEQGKYLSREWVVENIGRMITACKTRLMSIPPKCAPLARQTESNAEAKDVLEEFVTEALQEISVESMTMMVDSAGLGDSDGIH